MFLHKCFISLVGPDLPQINVTPYSVTDRGYSALEKETVSLLCQASSNPPSLYVWFYNNSQVYTGPQLTITKILRMHTGYYACLAQNTYLNTRSKKTITLTVYCESSTVMTLFGSYSYFLCPCNPFFGVGPFGVVLSGCYLSIIHTFASNYTFPYIHPYTYTLCKTSIDWGCAAKYFFGCPLSTTSIWMR